MGAKLIRLTHKIAIQLHLVVESYTTCSYRSRRASPETFGYTLVQFFPWEFDSCAIISFRFHHRCHENLP